MLAVVVVIFPQSNEVILPVGFFRKSETGIPLDGAFETRSKEWKRKGSIEGLERVRDRKKWRVSCAPIDGARSGKRVGFVGQVGLDGPKLSIDLHQGKLLDDNGLEEGLQSLLE
jgi:hypothetical protein